MYFRRQEVKRKTVMQNPKFSINEFGHCVDFSIFRIFSVSSEGKKKNH